MPIHNIISNRVVNQSEQATRLTRPEILKIICTSSLAGRVPVLIDLLKEMKESYTVSQITDADFLEYHDCLGQVARERKYLAFQDAPPIEGSKGWVDSHIKKNHPLHVIRRQERVVGWCDVTPSPRKVFEHCGELGMGLLPDFRGRGLGRLLIESVVKHSKEIGLRRIELDVRADNPNAIRLYEKTGFTLEGRKLGAYKVGGDSYLDVLLYGMQIKSELSTPLRAPRSTT